MLHPVQDDANLSTVEDERAVQAGTLAMALIISSQTPLVLLDGKLCVVAASASFFRDFSIVCPEPGRMRLADLGAGEWNVPQLLLLLRATAAGRPPIEAYELELVRPGQLTRLLILNAHKLDYAAGNDEARIVLALSDVTDARLADKLKDDLLRERALLMQELQHRIANSLQIIASVLLQSARRVNSLESRSHLTDAHNRVMSIATLQKQLATAQEGNVSLRSYFSELCESIAASMIVSSSQLSLVMDVDESLVDPRASVSLGLIVTELVINSLKHAFCDIGHAGMITISYHSRPAGWALRVSDDGAGYPADPADAKPGVGTGIVEALARQLGASVVVASAYPGTHVTVTSD